MLNKKSGFTLIELLVVIGIIGLLSTLAVAGLSYARNKAKTSKAQHDIAQIEKAISIMANDTNEWPGHQMANKVSTTGGDNEICGETDCGFGIMATTSGLAATDNLFLNWVGPYMDSIPDDPWGNQYFFDTDYRVKKLSDTPCAGAAAALCEDAAVIGSYGPDGTGYNLYNSDDIIKILKR
jgi:general secretion pathway protein G